MSDIICVTNRQLCSGDFLQRIKAIAECQPAGIILREKDLQEEEYEVLAEHVLEICKNAGTICVLHSFGDVAAKLSAGALHMPMGLLRKMSEEEKSGFRILGASCHSPEEAVEAQRLGCTYITAGHVFSTDCKKGMEPRGLEFLKTVCDAVTIPVYGIGGISAGNIDEIRQAGAQGACVMSGIMKCSRPAEYLMTMKSNADAEVRGKE